MLDDELLYLWYGTISRMAHTQKMEIAMRFGGLRGLWDVSERILSESLTNIQLTAVMENRTEKAVLDYRKRLFDENVSYVYPGSEFYPDRLYEIPDPPLLLFARGDISLLGKQSPVLAVVGARKASLYGRTMADRIVSDAAAAGDRALAAEYTARANGLIGKEACSALIKMIREADNEGGADAQ